MQFVIDNKALIQVDSSKLDTLAFGLTLSDIQEQKSCTHARSTGWCNGFARN